MGDAGNTDKTNPMPDAVVQFTGMDTMGKETECYAFYGENDNVFIVQRNSNLGTYVIQIIPSVRDAAGVVQEVIRRTIGLRSSSNKLFDPSNRPTYDRIFQ